MPKDVTLHQLVLRFAVTGYNHEAGARALLESARESSLVRDPLQGETFEVRNCGIDLDPGRVCGYANHSTFSVAQFLEQDEKRREFVQSLAVEALTQQQAGSADELDSLLPPALAVADRLKEYVEDRILALEKKAQRAKTDEASLLLTLLRFAVDSVAWQDLGESAVDAAHAAFQRLRAEREAEKLRELLAALENGEIAECDEQLFFYFLEVLPPVYMHQKRTIQGREIPVVFGFAEGYERIRAFWKEQDEDGRTRYFAYLTEEVNPHG